MHERPYLKNLNGLRFIAASYTIFFHYFSIPGADFLNNFFMHGHISVPFFFLLSGFVLSYSYQEYSFNQLGNIKKYLLSRFIRLAPIYYIAMILALPLLVYNQRTEVFSITTNIFYSLMHLSLLQALLPLKDLLNFWNIHSWSLSVEMFLYICSPILILKVSTFNIKKIIFTLVLLLTINCFTYLYFAGFIFRPILISNYFAPLYFATFANGVVIARLYVLKKDFFDRNSSYFFILSSLFLVASFFSDLNKNFYSPFNPFFHIGFSVLILSSSSQNKFNNFLGNRFFFFLGEASYAMYILQAPVKFYTQQFLSKVVGFMAYNGIIFSIIIFSSILICSILISTYIDPPARKYLKSKLL